MMMFSSFPYVISFLAYAIIFEESLAALLSHPVDFVNSMTHRDYSSSRGVCEASSLSSYISQIGTTRNLDQDEKSWFLSAYPGIEYDEGFINERGNLEGLFMHPGPDFKAPIRIIDPNS